MKWVTIFGIAALVLSFEIKRKNKCKKINTRGRRRK